MEIVNIYTEQPILDVSNTISSWFGAPVSSAISDISILFSYLILFVFVLSVFGLLFKGYKR